jgi:type I restriction enzyme M protein
MSDPRVEASAYELDPEGLIRAAEPLFRSLSPLAATHIALGVLTVWAVGERRLPLGSDSGTAAEWQVPVGGGLDALYGKRREERLIDELDAALTSLATANPEPLGPYREALSVAGRDPDGVSDAGLRSILEHLMPVAMDAKQWTPSDRELVDAVDGLLAYAARQGSAGDDAFRHVPRWLADLTMQLLQPRPGDAVYDPACGTGGLLAATTDALTGKQEGVSLTVCGEERHEDVATVARLALLLTGAPLVSIEVANPIEGPSFKEGPDALQAFDVITCLAPTGPVPHGNWTRSVAANDPYKRFQQGVPSKSYGETAYLAHMLASLRRGSGRMAGVFRNGVLYRSGADAALRRTLVDANRLDAVIALPAGAVAGSSESFALVVVRDDRASDAVTIIDASPLGSGLRRQGELSETEVDRLLGAYEGAEDISGLVRLVPRAEIQSNDYNLHVPRYITPDGNEGQSVDELVREWASLEEQFEEVARRINDLLGDLR